MIGEPLKPGQTCGWCQDGWPLIANSLEHYGHMMHAVPEPMCQVPCDAADRDFKVSDPAAIAAIEEYGRAIAEAEFACGMVLTEGCNMPPQQALTIITNRLLTRAAALACGTAIEYLGRVPDPERWRKATDRVFADVMPAAAAIFHKHHAKENDESDKS